MRGNGTVSLEILVPIDHLIAYSRLLECRTGAFEETRSVAGDVVSEPRYICVSVLWGQSKQIHRTTALLVILGHAMVWDSADRDSVETV